MEQIPEVFSQTGSETELIRWQDFERLLDLLTYCDLSAEALQQVLLQIAVLANAYSIALEGDEVFGSIEVNRPEGISSTCVREEWCADISLKGGRQRKIRVWRWGKPFADEIPCLQAAVKALSNALETSEKIKEEHAERVLAESLRNVAQVAGIGTMPVGLVVEVSQGPSLHLSG